MKKIIGIMMLLFGFMSNVLAFQDLNYEIQIKPMKQQQINKAVLLKQYLYDLKKLEEILWLLYSDKSFRYASHTAELKIKNSKSYYTTEFIKNLIRVLDGVDPYNDFNILNKGYIKYIEDIYNDDYKMYLTNYPAVITKNFDEIENTIKENLEILDRQYEAQKNIKPALRNIFNQLIIALQEVYDETVELVNLGVIEPFNKRIDYKYSMPNNWAQYNTTLAGMLNFILNGSKKYHYLGIKDYYNQVYKDDTQGLIITY
jgi:hypothetical protein